MIQVILLILKIIGIVLAVLLLTVLLLLALVLFVPIRYRVRAIHNPEKTDIFGRASFLFPILIFRFRYFEKLFSYQGRAFGFVFAESGKEKKEKKPKKKKGKKKKEKEQIKEENKEEKREEVPEELSEGNALQDAERREQFTRRKKRKKEKSPGLFAKIRLRLEKIRNTIFNIQKKLARLLRQKDEVLRILKKPETKEAILFAWGKLKKTVLHIIPKKIKGHLIYGGKDPAATGQVLGIVGVVYAMTGPLIKIIPDFEKERLECDLEFRGGLQIFTILVIAIKLYLNQELKQLIQEIKNVKEIE